MLYGFALIVLSPIWVPVWLLLIILNLLSGGDKWLFRRFWGQPDVLNTHGAASFATYKELKQAGLTKPNGGFLLGHLEVPKLWFLKKRVSVYSHKEASVVIFGPRGSGKTMLIRANLHALAGLPRHALPDVIVVDAVGEIERDFKPYLEGIGYGVDHIDMTYPDDGLAYDPLSLLDVHSPTFDVDVRTLCELILPDDREMRYQHFTILPRRLLSGSIIYHMRCEPNVATLDRCLQSIVQPLDELKKMTEKWAKLANDPTIRNAITVSKVVGDREFSSFITTMTAKFDSFLMPNWRAITQPGFDENGNVVRGWTFSDMYAARKPTALFIRTGLDGEITGPCVRLLLGNAISERKNIMVKRHGKAFPRGLMVMTDETRNLGNCEALLRVQNEMRKAGVNLLMTYLSRADVFQIFPSAKTLLMGMTEIYPGGITDWETLKHASQMTGQKTVKGRGGSEGRPGESWHEVGVPVNLPHEVKERGDEEWLVLGSRFNNLLKKPWRFGKDGPEY